MFICYTFNSFAYMERKRGRPKSTKDKILVAIRLERDVVMWLRKKGRYGGWLNKLIRREMKKDKDNEEV